jgi:hypothetical protein
MPQHLADQPFGGPDDYRHGIAGLPIELLHRTAPRETRVKSHCPISRHRNAGKCQDDVLAIAARKLRPRGTRGP